MLFSDYFNVDKNILKEYGAIDISLLSDSPLFIDPILIYGNDDEVIKQQYSKIINYLLFLNKKVVAGLTNYDLKTYFRFGEIKQNWLGVCSTGNKGLALGNNFAKELSSEIGFICNTNGVSESVHIEKMYLVNPGVGKDKISDWTTNILLGFFVDYTEKFAKKYIDPSLCKKFEIRKYDLDYQTGIFKTKDALLPCFYDKNGKPDYVLLTPSSILRIEDQEICYKNFESQFDVLRKTIPNDELRHQINLMYSSELKNLYLKKQELEATISTSEIAVCKKQTALKIVEKYPVLYDYFVACEEKNVDQIKEKAATELDYFLETVLENKLLDSDIFGFNSKINEFSNSFDESLYRVHFLKRQIEINGVWKMLYVDGKPIKKEEHLQSLFKLAWCRSKFMFTPEANSGVGPSDFLVSFGSGDSTVVEYKLASNSKLKAVFAQTEKYRISHKTTNKSIIVIFYFNDLEKKKAIDIKNNADQKKYEVVLIDCDSGSKRSASKEN